MNHADIGSQLFDLLACPGGAIFGVPGGQTLPLYAASSRAGYPHIVMRDERNAACAADAFARVTGTVGICDATVGPGATNLVSGLAEAQASSIPVLAIVADTRRDTEHLRRHSVASQSYAQAASLEPVTKWIGHVLTPSALPDIVDHAFRVATSGRPGPVVVSIPEDIFLGAAEDSSRPPPAGRDRQFPRFRPFPGPDDVTEVARRLRNASRPLVVAGGGVSASGAIDALTALASAHGIPVATTLNGKGSYDERSPLAMGVVGGFGHPRANLAVRAADLVIAVGTKHSQLGTHGWRLPASDQALVHVDIDGEELGRSIAIDIGIVADARSFFMALHGELDEWSSASPNWTDDVTYEDRAPEPTEAVHPVVVLEALDDLLGTDDLLVCEASLSSGWAARYYRTKGPGSRMIAPRGIGGLGWGPGATLGARFGRPQGRVVALTGDGGFGYGLAEINTAVRHGLDITTIVLNNSAFGWIQHVEDRLEMPRSSALGDIDFAAAATAMGAHGTRVVDHGDVRPAIERALEQPGPSVVEVISSPDVSPIVGFGTVRTSPYA